MMLAIELQQRGLTENVTIYEKATQVGGTWRDVRTSFSISSPFRLLELALGALEVS